MMLKNPRETSEKKILHLLEATGISVCKTHERQISKILQKGGNSHFPTFEEVLDITSKIEDELSGLVEHLSYMNGAVAICTLSDPTSTRTCQGVKLQICTDILFLRSVKLWKIISASHYFSDSPSRPFQLYLTPRQSHRAIRRQRSKFGIVSNYKNGNTVLNRVGK